MSPVDLSLLERWQSGRDAEAFAEIVSRYAGMVFATARRILHNPSDAEEVSQECFLYLARGKVKITSSLGGWLHSLATSRALDRIRNEQRRRRREADAAQMLAASGDALWTSVQRDVDEAIAALPDDLRIPIIEHFLVGRTQADIAEEHGLSRPAITHRIHEGIERIRVQLSKRGLTVGATVLTTMLAGKMSEATPATLVATLGRLALSGPAPIAPASTTGWFAASWSTGASMLAGIAILLTVAFFVPKPGVNFKMLFERGKPERAATVSAPSSSTPAREGMQVGGQSVVDLEPAALTTPTDSASVSALAFAPADATRAEAIAATPIEATRPYLPGATEAVLMGFVLDRDTGKPVAAARLAARGGGVVTKADEQGIYRLYTLPASHQCFQISADGYVQEEFLVDLPAAQETRRDFRLESGTGIQVLVVDEANKPVADATVSVGWSVVDNEKRRTYVVMSPTFYMSDANGRLRVQVSPERVTNLRAYKDGYDSSKSVEAPVKTWFGKQPEVVLELRRALGAVAGSVTDTSGNALKNIELVWNVGYNVMTSTLTDAQGRYRMTVGQAAYIDDRRLCARGKGWAPSFKSIAELGTAEHPVQVDFVLEPAHWISGTVVDGQGNVLADASVRVSSNDPNAWRWEQVSNTDETGRFRVEDIPGPGIVVDCRKDGWTWRRMKCEVDQDYTITLEPAGTIRGQVVDEQTEKPIAEFNIRIQGHSDHWRDGRWESFSSEDGRFVLAELDSGKSFRLMVAAPNYFSKGVDLSPRVGSAAAGEEAPVIVRLKAKSLVFGRIVDADSGAPIPDAAMVYGFIGSDWNTIRSWPAAFAADERELRQFLGSPRRLRSSAQGDFQIAEADLPGTLLIWPKDYEPVSVLPEDRSRYDQGEEQGVVVPIHHAATLGGRCMKDGVPWSGAAVVLLRMEPSILAFAPVQTDESGAFHFDGLPAGRFTVMAYEGDSFLPSRILERRVDLVRGAEKSVDVGGDLGPFTVTGAVVDVQGRPVPHAQVSVEPDFDWDYVKLATGADASGRYVLRGLRGGHYRLSCTILAPHDRGGQWKRVTQSRMYVEGDAQHSIVSNP